MMIDETIGTFVVSYMSTCRSDIAWNFEKFLVDGSGKPVQRFSKSFPTSNVANWIRAARGVVKLP